MKPLRILIAEDEPHAARRLEKLLRELRPELDLLARVDSVAEMVEFFNSGKMPDIAFFDIQLADGISFSVFDKVTVPCPVVFTTAFDQYAVRAFRMNCIDYLLKPVDPEQLRESLERLDSRNTQPAPSPFDSAEIVRALINKTPVSRSRFLVRSAGRLAFVQVSDVAYFFSDEGTTFLVTHKNDRFLLEETLEELESTLDPHFFFRISRKMIISPPAISRIEPHLTGRLKLSLVPAFEAEVMVSRQRGTEFRDWLNR